jgi:tetratricopeptide (TPR) repeat protein
MEALGEDRQDQRLKLAGLMARATLHSTPSRLFDFQSALRLSDQALELAQQSGDRAAEARILWTLLLSHLHSGNSKQAVTYGEQALALARELNLNELTAYILNDLSQALSLAIEDPNGFYKGYESIQEAQQLWRELDNQPMLVDSLSGSVLFHYLSGNYSQAIQASEEAYRISQKINNLWGQAYSLMFVGPVYFELGRVQKALDTMQECLRLSALAGFTYPLVTTRAEMGRLFARIGLLDKGFELVQQAKQFAEEQFPAAGYWLVPNLIRILIYREELDRAEQALEAYKRKFVDMQLEGFDLTFGTVAEIELAFARRNFEQVTLMSGWLERVRQLGVIYYKSGFLYLKGQSHEALGQLNEARQAYVEGRAVAEQTGSKWDLWPNLFALSKLERRDGNPQLADVLLKEAQEILRFIAGQIDDQNWRESYLALPSVRQVLQAETP